MNRPLVEGRYLRCILADFFNGELSEPSEQQDRSVSSSRMETGRVRRKTLLQIPETSSFNPYIALQASALVKQGYHVILPDICRDEPGLQLANTLPSLRPLFGNALRVLHIHWAEKLLDRTFLAHLLTLFRSKGFVIVRTHHNFLPRYYDHHLLDLIHGHHFFSHLQRRVAERILNYKFQNSLIFAHPYFLNEKPTGPRRTLDVRLSSTDKIILGCFGFIEPYKRTLEFARSFARYGSDRLLLTIAGMPGSVSVDRELQALASQCPAIRYSGLFLEDTDFVAAVDDVDYVILPYAHLWTSGVFVLAAQRGIPTISPTPFMLDLNNHESKKPWIVLRPWNDLRAIEWLKTRGKKRDRQRRGTLTAFPTWDRAGSLLDEFYNRLSQFS